MGEVRVDAVAEVLAGPRDGPGRTEDDDPVADLEVLPRSHDPDLTAAGQVGQPHPALAEPGDVGEAGRTVHLDGDVDEALPREGVRVAAADPRPADDDGDEEDRDDDADRVGQCVADRRLVAPGALGGRREGRRRGEGARERAGRDGR